MITSVRRLLLAYLNTTATLSPTSESVDRRENNIVMVSVSVVAVASCRSDGLSVASCGSNGLRCCVMRV
ncbi:hypothetical protein TNCV_392791 [Trichonephila clavipes]|nr:hypothetical protein TNCV_392791 [Trichonephila clavipes]